MENVYRKQWINGGGFSPRCFFNPPLSCLTTPFPFALADFLTSSVLMRATDTQVLRTLGLVGKKTSTELFSVYTFFFLICSAFVLCINAKNVFYLLFEKGSQFNRRKIHEKKFPNILSVNG